VRPFEYASATSVQQAVALLGASWEETEVLAGGSDLLALMKDEIVHPKRLINIKEIGELRGIRSSTEGVRIGALVTLNDLAEDVRIRQSHPALSHAADEAASPQIRNVATLGGNLCQRPRCWYFRGGFGLLGQGAKGESLVVNGDNRYHAILGNEGPAYFVSPSTVAPVLIAYGAKIRLVSPKGPREIPLEKFFRTPRSENEREHDLAPNEILTEVLLPSAAGTKSASYEVRQKDAFDWPYATASVVLRMKGNTVESARIVLGHVAPVPWISREAEESIKSKPINEETAGAAGAAAVAGAKPLTGNRHKVQLAKVAVKRALLEAARA